MGMTFGLTRGIPQCRFYDAMFLHTKSKKKSNFSGFDRCLLGVISVLLSKKNHQSNQTRFESRSDLVKRKNEDSAFIWKPKFPTIENMESLLQS